MEQATMRLILLGKNCWVGQDKEHLVWRLNPWVAFRVLWYAASTVDRQAMKHYCLPNQSRCSTLMEASPSEKNCWNWVLLWSMLIWEILALVLWNLWLFYETTLTNKWHVSKSAVNINEINIRINQGLSAYHRCWV